MLKLAIVLVCCLAICVKTEEEYHNQSMAIKDDVKHYVECSCSVQDCPDNSKFDPDKLKCVSTGQPDECTGNKTRATPGDTTKTKFDRCVNGKWVSNGTCPPGTQYDDTVHQCI